MPLINSSKDWSWPINSRPIYFLFLIAIVPSLGTPWFSSRGRDEMALQNKEVIQGIKSLNLSASEKNKEIKLLDPDGGYAIFLGDQFKTVRSYSKNSDMTFSYFRNKHSINMIVVSKELLDDERYKNDNEWQ